MVREFTRRAGALWWDLDMEIKLCTIFPNEIEILANIDLTWILHPSKYIMVARNITRPVIRSQANLYPFFKLT